MKKKIMACVLVTFFILTSFAWADSNFKVFWENEELTQTSAEPVINNNRLFIPVYLLKQANISVFMQGKSLYLSDNRKRYIKNLYLLDQYRRGFSDLVNKLDRESLNLLGNILLNKNVDDSRLKELSNELQTSTKISYENINKLAIIGDKPDGFLESLTCAENYKLAVSHLLNYKENRDNNELEYFYDSRLKALEAFTTVNNEYNSYFNLSLEKSLR